MYFMFDKSLSCLSSSNDILLWIPSAESFWSKRVCPCLLCSTTRVTRQAISILRLVVQIDLHSTDLQHACTSQPLMRVNSQYNGDARVRWKYLAHSFSTPKTVLRQGSIDIGNTASGHNQKLFGVENNTLNTLQQSTSA